MWHLPECATISYSTVVWHLPNCFIILVILIAIFLVSILDNCHNITSVLWHLRMLTSVTCFNFKNPVSNNHIPIYLIWIGFCSCFVSALCICMGIAISDIIEFHILHISPIRSCIQLLSYFCKDKQRKSIYCYYNNHNTKVWKLHDHWKCLHLGDNWIRNFHLGSYIVGYTVRNLVYGDARAEPLNMIS